MLGPGLPSLAGGLTDSARHPRTSSSARSSSHASLLPTRWRPSDTKADRLRPALARQLSGDSGRLLSGGLAPFPGVVEQKGGSPWLRSNFSTHGKFAPRLGHQGNGAKAASLGQRKESPFAAWCLENSLKETTLC